MKFSNRNIKAFIGLLPVILSFIGCEKTENPFVVSEKQKEKIVFQAESRNEQHQWVIDSQNFDLSINNWGLDPLFIPSESFTSPGLYYFTLEHHIENSSINSINKPAVDSILQCYYFSQSITISKVNTLVNNFNLEIDSFLSLQKQRLDRRIIDKKLYDQILTDCRETFSELFRQEYYKANIRSSSSIELLKTLTAIEIAVSAKEWERLVFNIENK